MNNSDANGFDISLKNLVSDRCGLWNAFSFLTFKEIVVNLLQDF